jgi:hypothetical protein
VAETERSEKIRQIVRYYFSAGDPVEDRSAGTTTGVGSAIARGRKNGWRASALDQFSKRRFLDEEADLYSTG